MEAFLKQFFHMLSPFVVLLGVLVIFFYEKMDKIAKKKIGGASTKSFARLETNIMVLHNQLVKIKTLLGILCVLIGALLFFAI